MSWQAQYPQWGLGATALKATGALTATTNSDAVTAGHGFYLVKIVVSAIEIASNDEKYGIIIQANTAAATSTWTEIGSLMLGPAEVNATGVDDVTDTYYLGVYNQGDHQIRVRTVIGGSISTGINFTADLLPLATRNA